MRYALLLLTFALLAGCGSTAEVAPARPAEAPSMAASAVPAEAPRDSVRAEPARLDVESGVLHGTVLLPAGSGPHPVVFLHPGSGPTDRDGNTAALPGQNNSLRLLAEALAERGVASLRVDKRGVGESAGALTSEADLRFDHYVEDAAAWLRHLDADPRFGEVVAGGHSEGALIALLAGRQADSDAALLIAGPGRPAGAIIREQLGPQLSPALYAQADSALAALERGETGVPSPPGLDALFRPSVQPYLASWLRYDPAVELATFGKPTLVVQGTTDVQASVADARALAASRPGIELVLIEGMNHVLKPVTGGPAEQAPSYGDPTLPLAPGLVDAVVGFVGGVPE